VVSYNGYSSRIAWHGVGRFNGFVWHMLLCMKSLGSLRCRSAEFRRTRFDVRISDDQTIRRENCRPRMTTRGKEENKVTLHEKVEGSMEINPIEQGQSDISLRDINNKVDSLDKNSTAIKTQRRPPETSPRRQIKGLTHTRR
jgi:hypothetical protein